jgi:hypothetical protein
MIQDTEDKKMSDMKSLWEERTSMFFDMINLINTGSDIENLTVDLKDNSEDIAKATCGAFKFDSKMKKTDHEEYYYKLVEKNHPIKGVKLTPEEDMWLRNYMSVSMLTRILKDNVRLLTDYLKYTKANIDGQKITDEMLLSNVVSITGFLKTISSTLDFELLNFSLTIYFRNLKKQADILAGAPNPELLEKELKISEEISQIIYKGMIMWRTEPSHQN